MKIAIIVGSTRPGRLGTTVGNWVLEGAQSQDFDHDVEFELLEVADFDLTLLNEATVPGAANRQYESAATRAWGEKIDSFDGFIFVSPEYNHGVPAALKNAFDVIYPEWGNKSVGFVAYGADGGVRATEQWRQIVINAHLFAVRGQVALSLFTDWNESGFAPQERRAGELTTVLGQVVNTAAAVKSLRA